VIGGELAPAGEGLLESIRRALGRWISPASGRKYSVVAGELGGRAEVLGAVALAMNRFADEALTSHESSPAGPGDSGSAAGGGAVALRRTRRRKQLT
jgi:hypothetical protein